MRPKQVKVADAFASGFAAAGYQAHTGLPTEFRRGDCLAIWNRRGHDELVADRLEAAGGTVLVAENAYLHGIVGYAVARHRHNGGGQPLVRDPARAAPLISRLQPWREAGGHVLVLPNRRIGPQDSLMPETWERETVAALKRITKREVRARPHPGHWKRMPPGVLEAEVQAALEGSWAVVIWWSSAGLRALMRGIPVISCAPYWIAGEAAGRDLASIDDPLLGDRAAALVDVANACLTLEEVASGAYFKDLNTCAT